MILTIDPAAGAFDSFPLVLKSLKRLFIKNSWLSNLYPEENFIIQN